MKTATIAGSTKEMRMTMPEPVDAIVQALTYNKKIHSYDTLISKLETENWTLMPLESDDIQDDHHVKSFISNSEGFKKLAFAVLLAQLHIHQCC